MIRFLTVGFIISLVASNFGLAGDDTQPDLIVLDSQEMGVTNFTMRFEEVSRTINTSTAKVIFDKGSSLPSVGSSMFIMQGFYKIANARGFKFFTSLSTKEDSEGNWIHVGGFTNNKNADIKKEFGDQYSYENKYGQKSMFRNVKQLDMLYKKTSLDKPDSGGGKSYKSKKEKLALDDLKNADYVCLYYGKGVRLKNGVYEEHHADSASKLHVGIYKDKVAFGDLNNDGRDDAVVVIESYSGGSGHFYELAVVINNNGKPLCFIPKRLGDRVIVNSVLINKAGKIIVDMIAHRPKDGLAKPTLRKIIEYKLYGYILIQLRENGMADEIDIEQYLHKKAIFWQAFPSVGTHGLSSQKAILFAVKHLKKKGIKNIKICETRWIAAPFGAYFIDGKGDFSIEEKNYSTFRIGVRDGTEEKNGKLKAGEECLFIARGIDNKGKVIWYPEPGPDFRPAEGKVFPEKLMVYEFLYGDDRTRFESLSIRFKSAKTEDETADMFFWKDLLLKVSDQKSAQLSPNSRQQNIPPLKNSEQIKKMGFPT